nr:ATP-binding protein [bacterium]
MGKINVLDENLINKIAAGEVIERPASIVKELIDNSIDAGSDEITVFIEKSGKKKIKIIDNGCGMDEEDVFLSVERHATSKI